MRFKILFVMATMANAASAAIDLGEMIGADSVKAEAQVGVVSSYMWRGTEQAGISIQAGATIGWQGASLSFNANEPLHKDETKEIILQLGYKRYGINVGVLDYWHSGIDEKERFFKYSKDSGPHKLELNVGYTHKWFSVQAYTCILGDDFRPSIGEKKRAYSTYVELTAPLRLSNGVEIDGMVGICPWKSAGYYTADIVEVSGSYKPVIKAEYQYAGGFSAVKAALRVSAQLKAGGSFSIPVFAELHTNPYMQTATVVCGAAIRF